YSRSAGDGWLMLDKSFQDVAFFASLRCAGECKTGILLRAERPGRATKAPMLPWPRKTRPLTEYQDHELSWEGRQAGAAQGGEGPARRPRKLPCPPPVGRE